MEIISRKEAKSKGLTKYFTGKVCAKGHICERSTARSSCIFCERLSSEKWRNSNKEKHKECNKNWRDSNSEKNKNRMKLWRNNNIEKFKNIKRKCNNIPNPTRDYPEDGLCECCGKLETSIHKNSGKIKKLSLDHDHITGKFRGWLCSSCNLGLGKLGDNEDGLSKALEYIRRSKDA